MKASIRNLFLSLTFSGFLFILLTITIQNSSKTNRINLIFKETVDLPISFIVGASFISGSLIGNILIFHYLGNKNIKVISNNRQL